MLKKILPLVTLYCLLATFLFAQSIKKMIKEHLYEPAIEYYESQQKNNLTQEQKKDVYLSLMNLYWEKSRFLKVLYQNMVEVELKYYDLKYKNLTQLNRQSEIPLLKLSLGICNVEKGNYIKACAFLSGYINSRSSSKEYLSIGKIWYGAALFNSGEKGKALEVWRSVNLNNALLKSEMAYALSRVGYDKNKMLKLNNECMNDISNPRIIRNVLQVSITVQEYSKITQYVRELDYRYTPFIQNKGQTTETCYYDPSVYYTASLACSYVSFFYGNMLNSICLPEEQEKYRTKYFRAQFFYEVNNLDECINCLKDDRYAYSKILLGDALYHQRENDKALEIFNSCEKNLNSIQKGDLGYLYHILEIREKKDYSIKLLSAAISEAGGNKTEYQKACFNLAKYYMKNNQFEAAAKYFSDGYVNSNPKSLSENPPDYRIEFAGVYIISNNFGRFEEIKRILQPVVDNFMEALPIWEVLLKIDVLTNIGRDDIISIK